MKRILTLALSAALVLSLAACASAKASNGGGSAAGTAIWTDGGYSCAVMSDVPMSADAMAALIAQVR